METLLQDLRYALRSLRKSPGFTAVTVLTLALGIGANTAMFSVVNAVLLRALPFREPERLMMLWEHRLDQKELHNVVSPANFLAWQDQARSYESMAAFVDQRPVLSGDGGESQSVEARSASGGIFSVLGVRPAAGRLFTADDSRADAPNIALLSYQLWRTRFGGRSDVIGKTIQLGGKPATIAGVLPRDFQFFEKADVWVNIQWKAEYRTFGGRYLRVIARLKPGVMQAAAASELATVARRQAEAMPQIDANWTTNIVSLQENLVGDVRPALLVLLGAVAFLLVIACTNVANLLLARATARQREMAIRTSIGATRVRLARQLLTESVVLGVIAGVVGLVIALWGTGALIALIPSDLPVPRLSEVGVDGRVLIFTALLSVLTGVAFGLAPALGVARDNLQEALKEGGRGTSGGLRAGRSRGALVVAELSLAVVLLAGAGLMIRSFALLRQVDPGFNERNALAASLSIPRSKYQTPTQQRAFFDQLNARISALPGVRAVGAISFLPLTGERSATSFAVEGRPAPKKGEEPTGDMRAVTPDYFRAMGIPLKSGRALAATDDADAPAVALVSETLARAMWPGESAVGKRVVYSWDKPTPVEIVGVVGDVHHQSLGTEPFMEIYLPLSQFPYSSMTLVVRTTTAPLALANAIRAQVRALDPDQAVTEINTLESLVNKSLGRSRLSTLLFTVFGGVGLVLAAVGIYGVISYGVTQRTHEIGLRMALGAQHSDVLRLIVAQGAWLAALGVAIGLAGAFVLTRLMTSLLFRVSANDPATYAGIALLLGAVALLASYLPARRAARVDPLIALRNE